MPLRSQCNNQLEQVIVNGGWSNLLGSCRKGLNNQLNWVNGVRCQHNCWVVSDGKQQEICAFSAAVIAEPIWARGKRLSLFTVALLAPVLAGCKKHSTSLIVAFEIAVVIAGTWVIVAVIVAVLAGKTWWAVMSFKLEWRSLSACSPVDVVVIGTESYLKCAGPLCGTGGCFAGLSFGSCKKLEVVIAEKSFGTESLFWESPLVLFEELERLRGSIPVENVGT